MIHLSRRRKDGDGNWIQPSSQWRADAAAATKLAKEEKDKHKADGNIYGADKLRAVMEKLFHGKCIYCEKELDEEWDVEHYRPKGAVAERGDHPGYYWLTYTWTNLFPSCKHCNQRRKDKPIWGDLTYGPSAGKKDQFPLLDESKRAMKPSDRLGDEEPLLLNPCNDQPEDHLAYDPTGRVFARSGSQRGEATIAICNLKRRRLVEGREKVLNRLIDLLQIIRLTREKGDIESADALLDFVHTSFLGDDCEHAGLARHIHRHPEEFGL